MKLTTPAAVVVAIILVLGTSWAAGVPDAANEPGRRLLTMPTEPVSPINHIKSLDSWLRWLLFRSRQPDPKVSFLFSLIDRINFKMFSFYFLNS